MTDDDGKKNMAILVALNALTKIIDKCPGEAADIAAAALASLDQPVRRPRVAIIVEGGVVQNILIDDPTAIAPNFYLIDYDTEGASPGDLYFVEQDDGTEAQAFVTNWQEPDATPPDWLDKIDDQLEVAPSEGGQS